jgi:hypothetical protein
LGQQTSGHADGSLLDDQVGRAHHQVFVVRFGDALRSLADKSPSELVEERFERLMGHGKFKEAAVK